MNLSKIPATIVTGFLGSGKTTLLSNMLKQANGKRIAVIVNEFGELDIDADLLRSCPLDCPEDETTPAAQSQSGVYELANGCICCTVEEEFLPVMQQLVARRDDIDHILIETSGLALPKPLVQAFNWPDIKAHCTVDSVITVIDGPAVAAGRFADNPEQVEALRKADENLDHDPTLQELLDDQLSAADLVIISKNDLLSEAEQQSVSMLVRDKVNPEIKLINIENGEISSALIYGLESASEERIEQVHTHHDHHHDSGHHHKHAHDDFDSVSIELGVVDGEQVQQILQQLIADHTIYRAKGLLALENKPMRQVVQGVGHRIDHYFDRLWQSDETPHSRIVMIGKQLPQDTLLSALKQAEL
ncbi:cobalamin biosynthesis protein CobW [Oleiphilus messinensis]|uniref:Cobalamin biosynthesis protein CobW n=1 Tax=Oleiphilus messinensis TaxID=141451 RepID=A0A1Y0IBP4_9GAMM|nr:cobalamin biosynthesis protein CobW [Oleiphilus messinensis]ARU56814.1 cobalamin biosynthesis protein CobW [Oleiphilus messinensis]